MDSKVKKENEKEESLVEHRNILAEIHRNLSINRCRINDSGQHKNVKTHDKTNKKRVLG
jgi:hypothetical protein